ncbi:hypothetical protein ABK040_006253 [Willaertia magna]
MLLYTCLLLTFISLITCYLFYHLLFNDKVILYIHGNNLNNNKFFINLLFLRKVILFYLDKLTIHFIFNKILPPHAKHVEEHPIKEAEVYRIKPFDITTTSTSTGIDNNTTTVVDNTIDKAVDNNTTTTTINGKKKDFILLSPMDGPIPAPFSLLVVNGIIEKEYLLLAMKYLLTQYPILGSNLKLIDPIKQENELTEFLKNKFLTKMEKDIILLRKEANKNIELFTFGNANLEISFLNDDKLDLHTNITKELQKKLNNKKTSTTVDNNTTTPIDNSCDNSCDNNTCDNNEPFLLTSDKLGFGSELFNLLGSFSVGPPRFVHPPNEYTNEPLCRWQFTYLQKCKKTLISIYASHSLIDATTAFHILKNISNNVSIIRNYFKKKKNSTIASKNGKQLTVENFNEMNELELHHSLLKELPNLERLNNFHHLENILKMTRKEKEKYSSYFYPQTKFSYFKTFYNILHEKFQTTILQKFNKNQKKQQKKLIETELIVTKKRIDELKILLLQEFLQNHPEKEEEIKKVNITSNDILCAILWKSLAMGDKHINRFQPTTRLILRFIVDYRERFPNVKFSFIGNAATGVHLSMKKSDLLKVNLSDVIYRIKTSMYMKGNNPKYWDGFLKELTMRYFDPYQVDYGLPLHEEDDNLISVSNWSRVDLNQLHFNACSSNQLHVNTHVVNNVNSNVNNKLSVVDDSVSCTTTPNTPTSLSPEAIKMDSVVDNCNNILNRDSGNLIIENNSNVVNNDNNNENEEEEEEFGRTTCMSCMRMFKSHLVVIQPTHDKMNFRIALAMYEDELEYIKKELQCQSI